MLRTCHFAALSNASIVYITSSAILPDNFEIGNLNWLRSDQYVDFFTALDKDGGFFYERWGDAPVHSIAAALLLPKEEIHFFNDIGYWHVPFHHCPNTPQLRTEGRCRCNPNENFDWNGYSCTSTWRHGEYGLMLRLLLTIFSRHFEILRLTRHGEAPTVGGCREALQDIVVVLNLLRQEYLASTLGSRKYLEALSRIEGVLASCKTGSERFHNGELSLYSF